MKKISLSFCKIIIFGLAGFFATGALKAQIVTTYNYTGSMQSFTVPPCIRTLTVQAIGAAGGLNSISTVPPGLGADISGVVTVVPGQVLQILVGECPNGANGGGGGSFVVDLSNNPIMIAGGGGGSAQFFDSPDKHGQAGTTAGTGAGGGGTGGTGGNGGNAGASFNSGQGGGLYTNGADGWMVGTGGGSFISGGAPGTGGAIGGYGGGGSGSLYIVGAGGGGYNGGGGGSNSVGGGGASSGGVGGGGGSYNSGTSQVNIAGSNSGNGLVVISYFTTIPPMTLTPVSPTCSPTGAATININGGFAPYAITWSGSAQTTSAVTGLSNGVHTITVSDLNNCRTGSVTVNVTTPSTVTAVTANAGTMCPGFSNTITAGAQTSYTWNPGASLNTVNGQSVIATPSVTTIYTVSYTNGVGCVNTATSQVFVYPAPTVVLTNTRLCIGYSADIIAGPEQSYTWSPGTNLNTTSGATVIANPPVTSTYNLAYTDFNGCIGSQTVQVIVGTTQTVSVADFTTCVGVDFTLLPNASYPGATYSWVGPNSFSSLLSAPTVTNPPLAASGNYSLTLTSIAGCTTSAVSGVTVYAVPSPTITTNAPICAGNTLSFLGSGAVNYSWQGPGGYTGTNASESIVNATTASDGVYTLTASFADGCATTITQSLGVIGLPVAAANYNNPLCAGSTLSLTASGGDTYTWTGPSGFSSSVQNPTIANASVLNTQGTYSLAISFLGCPGSSTSILVTVIALPSPTAANTSPACVNSSFQLLGSGHLFSNYTYTWTGPNGYNLVAQNGTITNAQLTDAGTYTVALSDAVGCTAYATTQVTVLPNPIITATGTNVCYGARGTVSVTASSGYNWTGPNSFVSTIQNPTVNVVNVTTSGIYSVVVTAPNSCTSSATASLGTVPLPTVVPVPAISCVGESATLSANGAITYTWAGPGSYASIGQNAVIPVTNPLSTGHYTVTGTAANTCTSNAVDSLLSIPLPIVIASPTLVCLHQPAIINSTVTPAGSTFYWMGPGGYTATTQNAGIAAANSVPITIYTLVVTAPNTCTSLATANLATIPLPTVAATSSLVCFNSAFTMTATGANNYVWTGPAGYTANTPTAAVPIVNGTYASTYTVVGTNITTGCSDTTHAILTTMPLPIITATGDTVCFGKPALLQASGGITNGYTWYGPINGSGAQFTIPVDDNNSKGSYMVVGTAPNSCTSSATTLLDFYVLPQPTVITPTMACFKSSIILQGFGAQTYTWTGPYNYMLAGQSVTVPIYDTRQAGIYTLTVLDNHGCQNSTTSPFITINPLPTGTLLSNNNGGYFCVPFCSTYTFNTTSPNPVTNIIWSVNGYVFHTDTFRFCATESLSNTAIASFTDAMGCVNTGSFALLAHPTPTADFIFTPDKPTEGDDQVQFTNASQGSLQTQWNWYFNDNDGYTSSAENTSFLFDDAGTYPVAMVVTNAWGCSDTVVKSVVITSDIKFFMPDAFTPNGDGLNDIFQPKGRGVKKYTLTIYDRWANHVFQTSDFYGGWDGSVRGSNCPMDVYVWQVNYTDTNGEIKELTGHVVLVR